MNRLAILFLALLVYGCTTSGSRIVKYRYVAYSWTDGNIEEMIEAWGTPNAGYEVATAEQPGRARWRAFSRGGSGEVGGSGVRYSCDTIAIFEVSGKITEIDILNSNSCHRYYKNLDSMLRPGVKPPPPKGSL